MFSMDNVTKQAQLLPYCKGAMNSEEIIGYCEMNIDILVDGQCQCFFVDFLVIIMLAIKVIQWLISPICMFFREEGR